MGSTLRRFTDEYMEQTVGFVIDDSRSIAEVAPEHRRPPRCHPGKWVKKHTESGPDRPLDAPERAESERLRLENEQSQMQVEFARKLPEHTLRWWH